MVARRLLAPSSRSLFADDRLRLMLRSRLLLCLDRVSMLLSFSHVHIPLSSAVSCSTGLLFRATMSLVLLVHLHLVHAIRLVLVVRPLLLVERRRRRLLLRLLRPLLLLLLRLLRRPLLRRPLLRLLRPLLLACSVGIMFDVSWESGSVLRK